MAVKDVKAKGIVSEIGMIRDKDQFRNFHLTIGITLNSKKKLTYKQGENLMKKFRKNFLGKNIELELVTVDCPICGKSFNSELGTKQHMRMVHTKKEVEKGLKILERAKKKRSKIKK